jgi:hypothetical protein
MNVNSNVPAAEERLNKAELQILDICLKIIEFGQFI